MFRRSGSVAGFFVEGSVPEPSSEDFCRALQEHRFRTIEHAAAEATSIGWVSPIDPTGDSFSPEDMDYEAATWLRFRVDKKSAPTQWLRIHRLAEERAAGRKLTTKERKDLKEDLLAKLLPRVLPTIRMIDALFYPAERTVLLFGTSNAVREAFASLFYKTFSCSITPADPYHVALSLDLGRDPEARLNDATPIRWPIAGGKETDQRSRARPPAVVAVEETA